MDNENVRSAVLEVLEASLTAQLKAVRILRTKKQTIKKRAGKTGSPEGFTGMSHTDMTYDTLAEASGPLHVSDIIARIRRRFGVRVDRESLVSALSKRVARQDRFVRTGKNTFGLIVASRDTEAPRP